MDIGEILTEGGSVLRKNQILMLPTIISIFVAFSLFLLVIQTAGMEAGAGFMKAAGIVINLFAHGVTLAMAKEALQTGTTSLGTGVHTAVRYFASFLIASIIMGIIISIGTMLFVIPGFIAAFFLLFTFSSIVVDDIGPVKAIARSFSVVRLNLKSSLLLFVIVVATGFLFWVVNMFVSIIPVLGQLIGIVLAGVFGAYISLVIVRAYMTLTEKQARTLRI